MTAREIEQYCSGGISDMSNPGIQSINIDTVISGYISRAVQFLDSKNIPTDISVDLQQYIAWLRSQNSSKQGGICQLYDHTFHDLCSLVSRTSEEGRLYVKQGESLLEFARGTGATLDIVETETVNAAHAEKWKSDPSSQWLVKYLDALAHKVPNMQILEIHDNGGSIAPYIVETLTGDSAEQLRVPQFQRLDISGSDEAALAALHEKSRVPTGTVALTDADIESPIQEDQEQYDLVILNQTINPATQHSVLMKARSMLKPGGKLVIIEPTISHTLRRKFIFGPSKNQEDLSVEPAASPTANHWGSLLSDTGFASTLEFPELKNALSNEMHITISSIPEKVNSQPDDLQHVVLVTTSGSVAQQHLAKCIQDKLQSQEYRFEYMLLGQALPPQTTSNSVVCVLCEIDAPIVGNLQEPLFHHLQQLLISVHRVLWVRNGAAQGSSPLFSASDGLFRVLNSEYDSRTFATLSIDQGASTGDLITRVLQSIAASTSIETEYVERSGVLHIPRLVEAAQASQAVPNLQPTRKPVLQPWNAEPDRKLSIATPGLLDSLHFIKDTDRATPLPDQMMEVKVKAVGVNFRDLLVLLGRMDQTTVGFECAGLVTRVGADCGDFKVGDLVVGCEFDTYRSYARLKRDATVRIPDGISFTEAAAMPINFVTAWHALSALANIQPGETVLIHSAAGGTGQAAVQVAQFLGANVIATVGSAQKRKLLTDLYGVPDSNIFSSRTTDFAASVKRLTGGLGADVIFNSLSGDLLTATWECIAPYGRFIEIGKRDIVGHTPLDMYHFERNVTFSAVDVALMVKERPHLVGRALHAVMPLLASGKLRTSSPCAVYGVGEMESALRVLQGGQSSGKVVVEMRDADMVKAIPSSQQKHHFDPNATYVIAGGLGGLGRGIARWMVSCGARNLLLLSRSGPRDDEAVAFLHELADRNVSAVATPCDITNRSMLEAFLGEASHRMPRIKGCIQATMVLQDAMFENMTYDQWATACAPKVQGSWNLHEVLPKGLDFFVMISSIASIMGNRGQANYAAANGFMDGLAHYRTSIGEKATSLNMGLFLSAGVATQSPELMERYLASLPFNPVTEEQLHALLAYHCNPSQPSCQTILGLEPTPAQQRKPVDSSYWLRKPAFRQLAMTYSSNTGSSSDDQDNGGDIDQELRAATTVEAATPLITALLVSKLSSLLSSPADEFDIKQPLAAYGVDSLVAVEIRNWFAKQLKTDIAVFDLLGGATLEGVGTLVATKRLS